MTTTLISDVNVICFSWAAGSSSLTLLLFSSFKMTMRTSLLHMKQWAVWSRHLQLPQHSSKCSDIQWHFERMPYHMSDSLYNHQKSTHSDSESGLHWCTMTMSSHLIWCDTLLYEWDVHTEQRNDGSCLREVSILNKLLLINKENWININTHKGESSNIHIVKNENSVSCQLWDTYLYNTYIVVVVDVVAAELVVWESVLTYSIKKDFTYKSCGWRSWRRKKKKSCMWGKGFITHFTDK